MFFITCFQKVEENKGWPDTGATRTFGYYPDKEHAIESLHTNNCDMHECLYMYALIEEIRPGIHQEVTWNQFFKYDKERNGFFEIDPPKPFEHITNIALG